jgi:hypothetical protein
MMRLQSRNPDHHEGGDSDGEEGSKGREEEGREEAVAAP